MLEGVSSPLYAANQFPFVDWILEASTAAHPQADRLAAPMPMNRPLNPSASGSTTPSMVAVVTVFGEHFRIPYETRLETNNAARPDDKGVRATSSDIPLVNVTAILLGG